MYIRVAMQCPAVNRDDEKDSPEHALEARYCLESRLLQRDVKLLFEGVSNQQLVLATVIHPVGVVGGCDLWVGQVGVAYG